MKRSRIRFGFIFLLVCSLYVSVFSGCDASDADTVSGTAAKTSYSQMSEIEGADQTESPKDAVRADSVDDVPECNGQIYAIINENQPDFTPEELSNTESYESYSDLDALGRCGTAMACIGRDIMPTEERGAIGHIKPTGWHTVKYDCVDGLYLYNRCHLIAYELAAENANEKNLITGTRYMNVEGMLPFENMVTDFIEETGIHVLYRVTPVFEGDNLVASGVQMEARSVEDGGEGICFNVYIYNVQPYIRIDYATGESWESDEAFETGEAVSSESGNEDTSEKTDSLGVSEQADSAEQNYVLNTNTGKFHHPDCSSVSDISEKNRKDFTGSRDELINSGYEPCGRCRP